MKAIATVGASYSAAAYVAADGKPAEALPQAALASHVFTLDARGCLVHSIDGRERATVPPEGFDDYARQWPDCAPLVRRARVDSAPKTKRRYG